MGESCTCLQENPKRANTKSYDSYESITKWYYTYKAFWTLGAKKADLAHDLARKYITIDDPQKQQALLANLTTREKARHDRKNGRRGRSGQGLRRRYW